MVQKQLLNLKTELIKTFTLGKDRDNLWGEWLCEEIKCTNGTLYFHENAPLYIEQRVSETSFNIDPYTNKSNLVIVYDTEIVPSQANNITITNNDNPITLQTTKTSTDTITVTGLEDVVENGMLSVSLPSYNTSTENYTGVIKDFSIDIASINVTSVTRNGNNVKIIFDLENTHPNQWLNVYTLFRDETVDSMINIPITLLENKDNELNLIYRDQNTKFKIEVTSIGIGDNLYMGKSYIQ